MFQNEDNLTFVISDQIFCLLQKWWLLSTWSSVRVRHIALMVFRLQQRFAENHTLELYVDCFKY